MKPFRSRLYEGRVFHQRYRPRRHRLSYRVFSMLIDLEELPELDRAHRLFAHNRFGVLSFRDRDHGPGEDRPLIAWVRETLRENGLDMPDGQVALLCYPRLFGYAFNPLGVYYCRDAKDRLKAVLYEVNNTFGERHTYLAAVDARGRKIVPHACRKAFYVSPFMAVKGEYRFRLAPPGEGVAVMIDYRDDEGPLMKASFSGRARAVSDAAFVSMVFLYPLMTLKVIAGIHWEALKLWAKGVRPIARPAPPASPVTRMTPWTMETGS